MVYCRIDNDLDIGNGVKLAVYNFSEKDFEDDRNKKKRRRLRVLAISIGAALIIGIAAIVIVSYYYVNRSFSGYDVVSEINRADSNNVTYRSFQNNLLKYSRDGISLLDGNGKTLWNGGYEMENPQVDICGEYVAVADIGAKKFYVYNGKDSGVDMEMPFPIGRLKVAANGKVAVLLHDEDSDVINIYDPYNTVEPLKVEVPTNVTDNGYPLDFDISPDGDSLVAAYMLASGGMETKVCFYNFTEVGQDQNTLVGGKSFEKNMISCIKFIAEDEVAICYENGFSFFENMKKPEMAFEKTFDKEIKSLGYDEDHILVITGNAGSTEDQFAHLFSFRGKEEMTEKIGFKYIDIMMVDQEIIFTDDQSCHILRKNGKEKFFFDFGKKYEYFFPAKRDNQYFLLDETTIKKIKIG